MPATAWALLAMSGVIALLAFAFVWALDRNDHLRRAPKRNASVKLQVLGRDVLVPRKLPRAVAIPTAWRARHKEQWPK